MFYFLFFKLLSCSLKHSFFHSVFQVVKRATGKCHETMTREFWDVSDYVGKEAQLKLIDKSSSGWGHINFDDLRGDISCAPDQ